jgi:hypothetical protein
VTRALSLTLILCSRVAFAAEAESPEAPQAPEPSAPAAYVPAGPSRSALQIHGYIDIGAAKAQGDGTSFSPRSERVPADYGVDTFAPAVNSRGDVASTNSNGRFTNGFLPRSMDIGGHGSAFINTASLDVSYAPEGAKYMGFMRLQFLPRVNPLNVNEDQLLVEQAFVRLIPFESQEFALTVGRFDGVFGIEYLENEAPLRTGVVPSLIARYTTGQQLGAKAFYRVQMPALRSALSLNVAATTNPPVVSALQPSAISLSGAPEFTARLGYELNHPAFQLKLGASASRGPRGDQTDSSVGQATYGGDARFIMGWVSIGAEFVHVQWDEGGADKVGNAHLVSAFRVNGGYVFGGLGIPLPWEFVHKITPYFRYDRRAGGFTDFAFLLTDRLVGGARLDVGDEAALKVEYAHNRELAGAPNVDNDVLTSSFVFVF